MPMPPPKPTTEGTRDRQSTHERDQLVRALHDEGPQSRENLERLVGARYWDSGRFDRALALAASDGLAVQLDDGRYGVT
jgi:hypothetical protein